MIRTPNPSNNFINNTSVDDIYKDAGNIESIFNKKQMKSKKNPTADYNKYPIRCLRDEITSVFTSNFLNDEKLEKIL